MMLRLLDGRRWDGAIESRSKGYRFSPEVSYSLAAWRMRLATYMDSEVPIRSAEGRLCGKGTPCSFYY